MIFQPKAGGTLIFEALLPFGMLSAGRYMKCSVFVMIGVNGRRRWVSRVWGLKMQERASPLVLSDLLNKHVFAVASPFKVPAKDWKPKTYEN